MFCIQFRCCGTTGAGSYTALMESVPPSCCPRDQTCTLGNSYSGCNDLVGDFFEKFSEIIAVVFVTIVAVEVRFLSFKISIYKR